ncbi:MAG: site-2 protease family protein, partial [Planctomycetota bacterium]
MEVLALSLLELWSEWIVPILHIVIGLGLVVFVHELGHFLVAKWVGINVERFALGFGPRLFGIKRGETDYCICALPLGGYVKMLGQEDFAPLEDEEKPDPRSYQGKSISARLAVISAGVVMNVIFAAILFVIVGLVGKNFSAPVVGSVRRDAPAAKVQLAWTPVRANAQLATEPATDPNFAPGLRAGDRVLELNGKKVHRFQALEMASALADRDETFDILVQRRDEAGREWLGRGIITVEPDLMGNRLVFGIGRAADTVFDKHPDTVTDTQFRNGDRLVRINGKQIEHHWRIAPLEKTLDAGSVIVSVERKGENIDVTVQPTLTTAEDVVWLADG